MADGMLNWLPNVQYNKESRFYTTQDIAEGAEKIKTADKAIRDLKRKRAVEKATANAIDAKGEFNEELARKSLIDSGFGEEADALVSDITSKRVTKTNEALDLRKKIAEAVAYGTLTQDIADQILGGKPGQTVEKAQVTQPAQPSDVTNTQFPQTKVPTAFDRIVNPQVQEKAQVQAPTQEAFRQTQVTPAYTSFGAIDYGKMTTPVTQPQKVSFNLSNDPTLRARQIKAAEQTLSIKIPNGLTNEQISDFIDRRAENIATTQNELKPPVAFGGDLSKYKAHEVEVASARGKAKQEILDKLSGQINTNRQLSTGERQATTSEKSQKLTEEKATMPGFRFKSDPSIILDISKQTAQAEEAGKLANELKGMKTTDPEYKGKSMTLAKTLIQAKGLGVSEGVLQSMTDQMGGAGFDIGKFIKQNASTLSDAGQNFLREFYRSQTTGNVNFIDMVKDVQRANRTFLYNLGPTDLEQFVELTPILGESNAEKQKWIDSKQKPKTARESLERKKKEGKKTSSAEGF